VKVKLDWVKSHWKALTLGLAGALGAALGEFVFGLSVMEYAKKIAIWLKGIAERFIGFELSVPVWLLALIAMVSFFWVVKQIRQVIQHRFAAQLDITDEHKTILEGAKQKGGYLRLNEIQDCARADIEYAAKQLTKAGYMDYHPLKANDYFDSYKINEKGIDCLRGL